MSVSELFRIAFIEKDRWKLYLQGLGITIEVSIFAAEPGRKDHDPGQDRRHLY